MNKRLFVALVLIFTMAVLPLSETHVKPANAQYLDDSPRPVGSAEVPEFTVKFIDNSYDASTTYSIDPYTGENITHSGHHVKVGTIEVAIKNPSGNFSGLFYNIRYKGHFEGNNWKVSYEYQTGYPYYSSGVSGLVATHSEYTIKTYSANGYSDNAQIDFQVQALWYYEFDKFVYDSPFFAEVGRYEKEDTLGQQSDWSDSQTAIVTWTNSSATPTSTSPSQTISSTISPSPILTPSLSSNASTEPTTALTEQPEPSPSIPELSMWVILPIAVVTVAATILRSKKKQ
jgi:hypothetical protein